MIIMLPRSIQRPMAMLIMTKQTTVKQITMMERMMSMQTTVIYTHPQITEVFLHMLKKSASMAITKVLRELYLKAITFIKPKNWKRKRSCFIISNPICHGLT